MEKNQPLGLSLVCILTVLTAFAMWVFALILFAIGEATETSGLLVITDVGLTVGFGVFFLVDAVLISRGMQIGYFLSMALWILLLLADIRVGYWTGLLSGYFTISLFSLFFVFSILYPTICFVYFLRRSVRTYFFNRT